MSKVEIIADSLNPIGRRLTSYILEYPRFVHAELMTHRMFSKNAASSRAIPIEKMIQQVIDNPAMPVWWGKNQSGMAAKEELDNVERKLRHLNYDEWAIAERMFDKKYYIQKDSCSGNYVHLLTDKEVAQIQWLTARHKAIGSVRDLMELGLHKQIANRILEPWFNIRIILSGTEFENFFALRAHPDAQPEIQELAYKMLEAYNASTPKQLKEGEWHIPFGDGLNETTLETVYTAKYGFEGRTWGLDVIHEKLDELKRKIAIARCARISYFNYEGKDDYEADIKLCDRLFGSTPRHLSPTEHVAQATSSDGFIGNFRGFKQYRYFFDDQNLKDGRIVKK